MQDSQGDQPLADEIFLSTINLSSPLLSYPILRHEKRDSGIGGIDDAVKILEEAKPKPSVLSPGPETAGDDTVPPQGKEGGAGEEEEEEEEENVITRIDEVSEGRLFCYSAGDVGYCATSETCCDDNRLYCYFSLRSLQTRRSQSAPLLLAPPPAVLSQSPALQRKRGNQPRPRYPRPRPLDPPSSLYRN